MGNLPHRLHRHWLEDVRSAAATDTETAEIEPQKEASLLILIGLSVEPMRADRLKSVGRVLTHRHLIVWLYRPICVQLSRPLSSHYSRCPASTIPRSRSHWPAVGAAVAAVTAADGEAAARD